MTAEDNNQDNVAPECQLPHRLGDMTWTEFQSWQAQRSGRVTIMVVPLGSCEQHGPHLPVNTDLQIAQLLCDRALQPEQFRFANDVIIAPAVTVGASGEHSEFPATLSIGTEVLTHVLVELSRSALPEASLDRPVAADAVVFVNGHGGNIEACNHAVAVLQTEGRHVSAWHPQVQGGDSHAGRTETSMLLAWAPAVVRPHDHIEGTPTRWREIGPHIFNGGLREVAPTGILGDPRSASRAEGAAVIDALVADLCQHLEQVVTAVRSKQ